LIATDPAVKPGNAINCAAGSPVVASMNGRATIELPLELVANPVEFGLRMKKCASTPVVRCGSNQ